MGNENDMALSGVLHALDQSTTKPIINPKLSFNSLQAYEFNNAIERKTYQVCLEMMDESN